MRVLDDNVSSFLIKPMQVESEGSVGLSNLSLRCLPHEIYIPVRGRLIRRRIYAIENNECRYLSFMIQPVDFLLDVIFISMCLLTLCKLLSETFPAGLADRGFSGGCRISGNSMTLLGLKPQCRPLKLLLTVRHFEQYSLLLFWILASQYLQDQSRCRSTAVTWLASRGKLRLLRYRHLSRFCGLYVD